MSVHCDGCSGCSIQSQESATESGFCYHTLEAYDMRVVGLVALAWLTSTGAVEPAAAAQAGDAAAVKEFEARVGAYVERRRRLEATLPPLGSRATAYQLARHRGSLARLIRKERAKADRGDLFTPAVGEMFRRIVARALAGRDWRAATADEDEPYVRVRLRVNGDFPGSAPPGVVPPSLLRALPDLPPELEFRIVDRDLALLDVSASLIVDYMRNVAP